jgi:hypothetical protein
MDCFNSHSRLHSKRLNELTTTYPLASAKDQTAFRPALFREADTRPRNHLGLPLLQKCGEGALG